MSEALPNLEGLLRQALVPIEPPEDLAMRLEATLQNLTEIAAEELDSWELATMRDPRNWVRPAAALLVGSSAGAALVLLRARHRQHREDGIAGARELAERTLEDLATEARKLLGRR
ncbi:MAG: hypothetical protein ACRDK2_07180 [Solirubrobacteraceae bacterium]